VSHSGYVLPHQRLSTMLARRPVGYSRTARSAGLEIRGLYSLGFSVWEPASEAFGLDTSRYSTAYGQRRCHSEVLGLEASARQRHQPSLHGGYVLGSRQHILNLSPRTTSQAFAAGQHQASPAFFFPRTTHRVPAVSSGSTARTSRHRNAPGAARERDLRARGQL
jgi:hypothetical protein